MHTYRVLLALLIAFLCISTLDAAGTYYIGKDAGGVYFQTDQEGGWYIDRQDLKNFKIGQTGTYYIKSDRQGTYIKTDKGKKFYIDLVAKEQLEGEIGRFNEQQDKRVSQRETKVIIKGNQVLVPVVLGYRGREIEALLLLDTGASIIVLHKPIADQLNIKQAQKAKLAIVGGKEIPAYVAKLNFARLGPYQKENIFAGIIKYEGPSISHQGLLGMNFLRDFEYRIDFKRQVLIWAR